MPKNATGDRIRKLRESAKYTQRELATLIGVSHITIQNWENGTYVPNALDLLKIADQFEVTTDWLLGREKDSSLQECLMFISKESNLRNLAQIGSQANTRLMEVASLS